MTRQYGPFSERSERRRQSARQLFRSAKNPREWNELLQEFVLDHSIERQDVLARFLCITAELRAHGIVRARTRVSASGAVWQEFKGSDGFIATHLMHCQLLFDGKTPDLLLPGSPRYGEEVRNLFGRCTDEPPWVNLADIVLESNGARQLLVDVTQDVVHGKGLRPAYEAFLNRYETILDLCLHKKEPLAGVPLEVILLRGELESVPHSLSDSRRDERVQTVLRAMKQDLPEAAAIVWGWFPEATAYRQRMAREHWFGTAAKK